MAGYYDRDRNPRVNDGGSTQGNRESTFSAAGTMNHPITHHGNTAEYMASGFPYVLYLDGNIDDAKLASHLLLSGFVFPENLIELLLLSSQVHPMMCLVTQ